MNATAVYNDINAQYLVKNVPYAAVLAADTVVCALEDVPSAHIASRCRNHVIYANPHAPRTMPCVAAYVVEEQWQEQKLSELLGIPIVN